MVIDAAKGIEAQTRKLFEVCRLRDMPIVTFINKMDREARDPLRTARRDRRQAGAGSAPVDLAGRPRRPSSPDLTSDATLLMRCRRPSPPLDAIGPARSPRCGLSEARPGARRIAAEFDPEAFARRASYAGFFGSAIKRFRRGGRAGRAGRARPAPRPQPADARAGAADRARADRAWSSRSRPTWTRTTGTASRSSESVRAG